MPGQLIRVALIDLLLIAVMQERVALEELNRDLSAAQSRVERWAQAKLSSAAELKEKHAVNVESLRGECVMISI